MIGPAQLERDVVRARAQAVVAVELRQRVAEAHLLELVDGARREPVAARLLARECLALDDDDVVAGACEPVGRGRAGGTAADDEDVVRRVVLPADGVAIRVEGWLRALGDGHEVGLGGMPARTSRS